MFSDEEKRSRLAMSNCKAEKIRKEVEKLLKIIQKTVKTLNCVATEKCQINFSIKTEYAQTH